MIKSIIIKCGIFLLLFSCCYTHGISAHESHSHSHDTLITIGKKTFIHLKSALSVYQDIYDQLVKKDFNRITDLAEGLSEAAQQAIRTEPEGPGRHMMEHVLDGATGLQKAKGMQEAQEAFASVTDALSPFFTSWPNQLKRNKLKLCRCKNKHCWLQPQYSPLVCPYSSAQSSACLDIEVKHE
ncbi:MAG: hypothetical protein E3K32_03905 [wastewater metagenome]|nr:hypothetical protein [Candidatus Loosdrechtia aerotolerans]